MGSRLTICGLEIVNHFEIEALAIPMRAWTQKYATERVFVTLR